MTWVAAVAAALPAVAASAAASEASRQGRAAAETRSETDDAARETLFKIRSAFLLQLSRFTRWPDERFADAKSPIVIGIPRGADIGPFLAGTVRGRTIGDRPIRIRELDLDPPPSDGVAEAEADAPRVDASIQGCHIVYVPGDQPRRVRRAWMAARARGVLMVSDDARLIERGAIIALPVKERRVNLVVHRAALAESGVELSSRVLKLAEVIEDPLPATEVASGESATPTAQPDDIVADGGGSGADGFLPADPVGGGGG